MNSWCSKCLAIPHDIDLLKNILRFISGAKRLNCLVNLVETVLLIPWVAASFLMKVRPLSSVSKFLFLQNFYHAP